MEAIDKYRHIRRFLPETMSLSSREDIQPYTDKLLSREVSTVEEAEQWLFDRQEVEAFVKESFCQFYIRYTCNTEDREAFGGFQNILKNIMPELEKVNFRLNKIFLSNPYMKALRKQGYYEQYFRLLENTVELYTEENTQLKAEVASKAKEYASLQSNLTIDLDGKEHTLQQAGSWLKAVDRKKRRDAFEKIHLKRLAHKDPLNDLFDELLGKRTQIARNSGFDNYRDYRFRELSRFDYTPDDCYRFHEAVRTEVLPIVNKLQQEKKEQLRIDHLRPYDLDADGNGKEKLTPFKNPEELVRKTIHLFEQIQPEFGSFIREMENANHLDLESRKGKAPGGYNMALPETGMPFIFMNAAGNVRDMITMIHEGGHAVHSFYKQELALKAYHNTTPEVSELASMAFELIAMDHYDEFFADDESISRARQEQLERVLNILPWIVSVDRFQHELYTRYDHSLNERDEMWLDIHKAYTSQAVNWDGLETIRTNLWQSQLHIFEIPFYYIEYGIAQLGAIAVWKNYKEHPTLALEHFKNALKTGASRPVPEIYERAGIGFDFSREYIRELMDFVLAELKKIRQ